MTESYIEEEESRVSEIWFDELGAIFYSIFTKFLHKFSRIIFEIVTNIPLVAANDLVTFKAY